MYLSVSSDRSIYMSGTLTEGVVTYKAFTARTYRKAINRALKSKFNQGGFRIVKVTEIDDSVMSTYTVAFYPKPIAEKNKL